MTDPANDSFESAIAELEILVQHLERNEGSLEDSITTFQRATELAILCRSQLDSAQLRITELMPAPDAEIQQSDDEDTDDVPF